MKEQLNRVMVPVILGDSPQATTIARRLYRRLGVVSHVYCARPSIFTYLLSYVRVVRTPDYLQGELLLEDLQAPQPQQELVRRELKNTMDGLLQKLTDRQQQVLKLRFGMDGGTCLSYEKIAQTLGISKERARQIEREAMEKLKKMGADLGLEDFLE